MREFINLIRDAEAAYGQYRAWGAEDAYTAQRARDAGETERADKLDTSAQEWFRLAEDQRNKADKYAARLERHFDRVQRHSPAVEGADQ